MKFVAISPDNGICISKKSLEEKAVSVADLYHAMEVSQPLDDGEHIMSFGPHFGGEAADEFCRRLEDLGLKFVDDYFVINFDVPTWMTLYVKDS